MLARNRAETLLAWFFRANGVVLTAAWPAVFFPTAWMASIHAEVGLGELPQAPIVEYLTRSASAIYGMLGVACFVLASDLRRFAPLVTLSGVSFLVLGALLVLIDLQAGMPAFWVYLEGPLLAPFGAIVLTLQARMRRESAENDQDSNATGLSDLAARLRIQKYRPTMTSPANRPAAAPWVNPATTPNTRGSNPGASPPTTTLR